MTVRLPFNIYSIEDIDAWRHAFRYPLSIEDQHLIGDGVCNYLIDTYARIDDSFKLLYRIGSKNIYSETVNVLFKLSLSHRMKSFRSIDFTMTNHRVADDVRLPVSCDSYELYRNRNILHFPFLLEVPFIPLDASTKNFRKKTVWMLKKILKKTYRTKKHVNKYIINPNSCTFNYLRINGLQTNFLPLDAVYKRHPGTFNGTCDDEHIIDVTKGLCLFLGQMFERLTNSELPTVLLEKFKEGIYDYFSLIKFDLQNARAYFETKIGKKIELFTGTAKHHTRIISEVVRENSGTVVGFPHGGGGSFIDWPSLAFVEFATCDKFICFHPKEKEEYEKYPLINTVQFDVLEDLGDSFLHLKKEDFKKPAPLDLKKISTIMYVNIGTFYDEYYAFAPSDLILLDLQFKILDFLVSLDKKIIFKMRPKTSYIGKNFNHFGYYGDKVCYTSKPLKQVLDTADLFVFEGGASSLHEAMYLTQTPIILFDKGYQRYTDNFRTILKKRCHVINLHQDCRNRLHFTENDLKAIFFNG